MTKTGRPLIYDAVMETRSYTLPDYLIDTVVFAGRHTGTSASAVMREIIEFWIRSGQYDLVADHGKLPSSMPEGS
jgi:hypothetical protein